MSAVLTAVGIAFLADLAQKRSLASAVVAVARNWRRRAPVEELPALETLELATLSQRIGVAR